MRVLVPRSLSGRIVRCTACSLVFASPRNERLLITHSEDEAAAETAVSENYYLKELETRTLNAEERLNALENFLPHRQASAPRRGKLLELGSYIGVVLSVAQKRGWDVLGIEPVAVAAHYGEKTFGVKIRVGTIEEIRLPPASFDAVALYETIEHLPDPLGTMTRLARVLKQGGIISIETPNSDSFWFRLLNGKWRQCIESHYYFFSPKTITALLKKIGCEILEIRSMPKIISLRLLATQVRDNLNRPLGVILLSLIKILHIGNMRLRINLGDVMIVHARKK